MFLDCTISSFPMKSGSRPGVLFGRPARRTIMYVTHFQNHSPDFILKFCLTLFSISNLFTPHSWLLKVCSLQCQMAPPCMMSSASIRLCLTVAFSFHFMLWEKKGGQSFFKPTPKYFRLTLVYRLHPVRIRQYVWPSRKQIWSYNLKQLWRRANYKLHFKYLIVNTLFITLYQIKISARHSYRGNMVWHGETVSPL